jgi:IS5 family transposase
MRQQTLAAQAGFEKYARKTRRELFLEEMEQMVPWAKLKALVACRREIVTTDAAGRV